MRPRNIWLFCAWLILGNMSSSFFSMLLQMQKFILPVWIIFNIAHMSYFFIHASIRENLSWSHMLSIMSCAHILLPYDIYLLGDFWIISKSCFSGRGLNLLKCLLSKCKELNLDPLNQCKESCVWRYVPAPPALGEVEIGRLPELIGHPETPRVWTLGFMSDLGSKTKGGEQSWKNV